MQNVPAPGANPATRRSVPSSRPLGNGVTEAPQGDRLDGEGDRLDNRERPEPSIERPHATSVEAMRNPFLYPAHEMMRYGQQAFFGAMSAGFSMQSSMVGVAAAYGLVPRPYARLAEDVLSASSQMAERFARDYKKPSFNLNETHIAGKTVPVTEEVVCDKTFGSLLHFKRDTDRKDPKLLIVAPMSGHFATLLRDTVAEMLPNHDVYITDWKDARDISLSEGRFGLDDYVTYVKDFIKTVGTGAHVLAVCQPTVPTLAAVASLAEEKSIYQPRSMTLMGGPIDTGAAATDVTRLAEGRSIEWFARNLVGTVPANYKGAGRPVYPGFMQLFSFMSMHPEKHIQSHGEMYSDMIARNLEQAEKKKSFYDEYFAVFDLDAKFYLDTVQRVFINRDLARGEFRYNGKRIDPSLIRNTALFTVEGEKDDISAPGQTTAAQKLCKSLTPEQRYHYLQPGVGHFGIFSGRHWRDEIAPRVTAFIRDIEHRNGVEHPAASASIAPQVYAKV